MPRPVCFVVMPFRTKETRALPPAPPRVNFDALWEKALRPVIEELNYEAVRADQDLGSLIINEMLERLYFADLVVADLTIPNANVYYEIGIRHAAKNAGCVLVAADWSSPAFDVDQMRQVRYPLPEGDITDATAAQICDALRRSIPPLAEGVSPMFQTLDGYPAAVKAEHATVMRRFLEDLSTFQAAARAVRLAPKADRRAAALALQQTHATRRPLVPAVALEVLYVLRDFAEWNDTLTYIGGLPDAIARLPAVIEQRCLAQSKSGDHRIAIAALEELVSKVGASPERMGLIGGRYKKLAAEVTDPIEQRRFLSAAIAAYEKGMQIDLNDYYPSSNLPRLYRSRAGAGDEDRARTTAAVAMTACLRSLQLNPTDEWVRPTLLGMAFDAGDLATARQLAAEIERDGPVVWKLATTIKDLERSRDIQQDPAVGRDLASILTSLQRML